MITPVARPVIAPSAATTQLLSTFRCLSAVVLAVIREDGQLQDCNEGFRKILSLPGGSLAEDVSDVFVAPRFLQLTGVLAQPGQPIHQGVLNLGNPQHFCRSLIGTVHRDGPYLVLLAEHDVADMEALNANVVEINEQLAEAQRELARKERHLRQTKRDLEAHRDQLEVRVTERTLALSIAKEAAEAASRAKSTFLANMSHELRTPMNAIMGLSELALRRANDPKQQDQLDKVIRSARKLLAILNDLLDISSIEARRLTLENTEFQLAAILDTLVKSIRPQALSKGLTLKIQADPALAGLSVEGDPLRLGQILLNLADNAVKFTQAGTISVAARLMEKTPGEALVRFEVRDTGIGISREEQQRLFSSFEQLDNSSTRKYGGTGLGLAICQRLAQMMGGKIWLESAPGAGSLFCFTARLALGQPAATAAHRASGTEASTPAEAQLTTKHSGTRVLVVEEEPINQEILREILEDIGFSVELSMDSHQAQELAQRAHYDLMLIATDMPHGSGYECARHMRALPGWQDIPIIAMTSAGEDARLRQKAGMDDTIVKPLRPAELYSVLLRCLARSDGHP